MVIGRESKNLAMVIRIENDFIDQVNVQEKYGISSFTPLCRSYQFHDLRISEYACDTVGVAASL